MSRQPTDPRDLPNYVNALERRIKALEDRSPFFGTGMHPNGQGGIDSDNFVAGAAGYSFRNDGNAEFNDLTLRGGIIGNSALAEPLTPVAAHDDAQSFNPGVAWSTVCTVGLTVPAGYSRLLIVTLAANATAQNQSAATDFLYVRGRVNGASLGGWVLGSADVAATGTGVAFNYQTGLITGLTSGGTVTLTGQVSTGFGSWGSSASNIANLDFAGLWLR